jgi:hypothetical protein
MGCYESEETERHFKKKYLVQYKNAKKGKVTNADKQKKNYSRTDRLCLKEKTPLAFMFIPKNIHNFSSVSLH